MICGACCNSGGSTSQWRDARLQPVTTLNPLLSAIVSTAVNSDAAGTAEKSRLSNRLFLFLDTNALIDMVDPHLKAHLSPGAFTFEELLKKVGMPLSFCLRVGRRLGVSMGHTRQAVLW